METTVIKLKGINRHSPAHDVEDGFCDELINLRKKTGRLTVKGSPTVQYPLVVELDPTQPEAGMLPIKWSNIWVHDQDNILNWIGYTNLSYDVNTLRLINFTTGETTIIKQYDAITNVVFLKRFMIVVYPGGMDKFIWKDNEYKSLELNASLQFSLYLSDNQLITSAEVEGPFDLDKVAESARGFYYKKINEVSADNYFSGAMFVRAAFKLFDGSYVFHTIPKQIAVPDLGIAIYYDKTPHYANIAVKFTAAKLKVILLKAFYDQFNDIKDIVSSVVLFGSKVETIIKIDESIDDEIKETVDNSFVVFNQTLWLNDIITATNPDFKKLCDTPSWYKIGEWNISDIIADDINTELDLNNFYQDYATREVMPVDQFSHHKISGSAATIFNARLHLAEITTAFGDYKYFPLNPNVYGEGENLHIPPGYIESGTLNIRLLVTLSTDSGDVLKLGQEFTRPKFVKPGEAGIVWYVALGFGAIGYPDARATKIEILYQRELLGWVKAPVSYSLKKSENDNFAYYASTTFNTSRQDHYFGTANFPMVVYRIDTGVYSLVQLTSYPEKTISDSNRVQVSEVNNPYYFPAKYSYIVGTGKINDMASNTEPLSTGQFGEHPLQVFTSKGIYVMVQGSSDILYANIVPVSGEVVTSGKVIPVSNGVVYLSKDEISLIQGKNVTVLSQLLTGRPNTDLQANANYQFYLSDVRLCQLLNSLSQVSLLSYLTGASLGFDKDNNELMVTNPAYDYSYIFNFDSNEWYKTNESFEILINYYPKLYAVRPDGDRGIVSISDETTDGYSQVLFTTQPLKLGAGDSFKVIMRIALRCLIEQKEYTHAGFYIFGSSDLINWQRLTGINHLSGRKRDFLRTRVGGMFKYYIVVFAGQLKQSEGYISDIDVMFNRKLAKKLR